MKIQVEGKQMDVGASLSQYANDELAKVADKYFDHPIEAKVVFSKDNHFFKAEILIHANKGINLQAHGKADEAYPAFDACLDVLEGRLRKHKNRLKDHHRKLGAEAKEVINSYIVEAPVSEEEGHDEDHIIIAEIENSVETMSVADAAMRLELANLNALMFINSSNNKINMVYRREDDNIGWVDPSSK
ncbi:MAG: ribosome-associated translation inhibitor RaiA [Alphaproteobacteria bacterium]|nr:ribosome-associated translation inhibitor RaiA [Alphaproteobacteria bacterium]